MKNMKQFLFLLAAILITNTMTTAQDKKIPDYSLTERKDIPVEYTWKMEDLYQSDDEWKADKESAAQLIAIIDELSKDWTTSAQKMREFLDYLTVINVKLTRLYAYAGHQNNSDLSNPLYQSMVGDLQTMYVGYSSKLSFFDPNVLKLGEEKFSEYLSSEPGLENYKFSIQDILRNKNHVLPDEQQKIVSMTGLFGGVPSKTANMLNDVEVPNAEVTLSTGEKVVLNYANYTKYRGSANAEDRSLVMREFWKNQMQFKNTLSILQDGAIKQHLFSAKVRNFNDCLEARLFSDNIPVGVYEQLIKSVKENLKPLHRYLKMKKEMLKLSTFRYEDVYASSVPSVEKLYEYNEATEIITKTMEPLGKEYVDALKTGFNSRWIDIYPNKGKETGAYSDGVYGVHPYIKMNYDGRYNNVSTLAHELGHAMHSYLSGNAQHYANSNYPTFLAEIASTFNENLLMEYLLENEKDDMFKLFILDNYIEQIRGTLYRQTLFAEFELEMHKRVEQGGTLTADWLNEKYLSLTREYYGHDEGVCIVDDYIQNEWSRIPHFYMNYYVFQYSTGIIASMALTNLVLTDNDTYREKYLDLLRAGGHGYAIDLLKTAGVDMTSPVPYNEAFKRINHLLDEMEKIVASIKN